MRRYRRNPESLIEKAMRGAYHRPSFPEQEASVDRSSSGHLPAEQIIDQIKSTESEPSDLVSELIEAYYALEGHPEDQKVLLREIKRFAVRNNPETCQCDRGYRRNPDMDGREIERQLLRSPDDPVLRQQMLLAKIRAGKLSPDNVLFRLAGLLGDTDVRSVAKDAGITDTWGELAPDIKFPKLMITRLLKGADAITPDRKTARLEIIAGITALLLPFDNFPWSTVVTSDEWDQEFATRYSIIRQVLEDFVKTLLPPRQRSDARDMFGPLYNIPHEPDRFPLTLILWSLNNIGNIAPSQRNMWLSYLEGASNVLLGAGGTILLPKKTIYDRWQPRIDGFLYSWDRDLPPDISLYPYLT